MPKPGVLEVVSAAAGLLLVVAILIDAFEAIILPRRATRRFRPTRLFYTWTWRPWSALARRMSSTKRRESFLGFYGPLSMLMLLAFWAASLILGFALLHWSAESMRFGTHRTSFASSLYLSGTTFCTLGLGDVAPKARETRILTVIEAGTGFGFLAIVIGYLPVLYGAFSRREISISLLDARAGSPPSALALLRRFGMKAGASEDLHELLRGWEVWAAELMESHLSYPVLCYYRSQHDNQSWLAALTTVLDTCALLLSGARGDPTRQARFTFAIARHAVVDIAQIFKTAPRQPGADRFSEEAFSRFLASSGLPPADAAVAREKLAELRKLYEPYVHALSEHLMMPLPAVGVPGAHGENWRTSAWERASGRGDEAGGDEEHS